MGSELELATTLCEDGGRPSSTLHHGDQLARYVVLERIGAGATGVVYSAYDPELDRRVAVKLLQRESADRPESQKRLVREARALAQLSHPNVVTIHDVGTFDDRVFIAMEFVEGETLTAWLQTPRTWSEILAVFRGAGEGLAAAHAAGLVHRDFKPDNVMVDPSRVRVMDFGLARPATDIEDETPASCEIRRLQDISARTTDRLTRTGAVMGTPAYMAPELFHGLPGGPLSDQFSFAVALHEALFGERPFEGDALVELALSVTSGHRRATERRDVPIWLCDALSRPLEIDPEDRHRDMRSLLDALAEPARPRRLRWLAAGTGVLAAIGIAWTAGDAEPCPTPDARVGQVWNQARAAEISAAFTATGLPFATRAAAVTVARLDAYAGQWSDAHVDVCVATRVRGGQSDAMFDKRMACLDGRLQVMAGLVDAFADADGDTVTHANAMASGLGRMETCADREALEAGIMPPESPEDRIEAQRISAALVQAELMGNAGNEQHVLQQLDALLVDARALDYAPVIGSAQVRRAHFLDMVGREPEALEAAEEAFWTARAVGDRYVGARAGVTLAIIFGARHEFEAAEGWLRHAAAHALDLPATSVAHWQLDSARGEVEYRRERFDDAKVHYERALERCRDGGGSTECGSLLAWLGDVEKQRGNLDLAVDYHEQVVAEARAELGDDHPEVAKRRANLAQVLQAQGKLDAALEHLDAAEAILASVATQHAELAALWNSRAIVYLYQDRYGDAQREFQRALDFVEGMGREHPMLSGLRGNVAMTLFAQGDYESALALHYKVLASVVSAYGEETGEAANVHANIGDVLAVMDRWEEAREQYEQTLRTRTTLLGPEHPHTARSECNLGEVARAQGRLDEAHGHYTRCLRVYRNVYGESDPMLTGPTTGLGKTALLAGKIDDGIAALERAQELVKGKPGNGSEVARVRAAVGRARWDAGRDRAQARADVLAARDTFAEIGGMWQDTADDLTAWLESHRL